MEGKREMYHTVTNPHIFQGGNWGRESECIVISQFAQKAKECIGLLDISPLACLTRMSGSWQINTPSRKKKQIWAVGLWM